MKVLLDYGVYSTNQQKKDLLFQIDNPECLGVMIKYIDINTYNNSCNYRGYCGTLLHGAVIDENLTMVKWLLDNGANVNAQYKKDPINTGNFHGIDYRNYTPLHFASTYIASEQKLLDMIYLLLDYGADKNAKTWCGKLCYDLDGVGEEIKKLIKEYKEVSYIKEPE